MFGEKSHVVSLESRKLRLIAESEINRAQLRQEWAAITGGVSGLAHRARSLGSFASIAAALMAGLGAFRGARSVSTAAKSSGLETVLRGARLACSIWLMLRARSRS